MKIKMTGLLGAYSTIIFNSITVRGNIWVEHLNLWGSHGATKCTEGVYCPNTYHPLLMNELKLFAYSTSVMTNYNRLNLATNAFKANKAGLHHFFPGLLFYVYIESPSPKNPGGPHHRPKTPSTDKPEPQKPNLRPQIENPKPP